MILSLLKVVCIALVGVGVHTPTPTLKKEDTKPQQDTITINENDIKIDPKKASGDESQITYSQDLEFTTRTPYEIGPWGQNHEWYANPNYFYYEYSGKYQAGANNTSPYNISYIQRENKLSMKEDNGVDNIHYGLSVGTFNDDFTILMNAVKIDTNKPTQETNLSFYNEYMWRVQNNRPSSFVQKYIMTIQAFIGYGTKAEEMWSYANNTESNRSIKYRIDQQIANWQIVTNRYEQLVTIEPNITSNEDYKNVFGFVSNETYHPNILATGPTYIFEFVKILCENGPGTVNTDVSTRYTNRLNGSSETPPPWFDTSATTSTAEVLGSISSQEEGRNHLTTIWTNANIVVEVIDIPGLMFDILSMPFTFISTAFNLTLFPGTRYQINISNLVLTIFGILVFIFILKLVLKK